jgi:hypothetical protein|tara:strand:- start:3182 stop:4015 length:834 start_codon:yes stop_codon:yes gene_type:complete
MSARDDIIEVPIEIKTSDLDELHRLLEELQEAKGVIDNAKSTKRRMPSSSGSGGAPIQNDVEERETLGIYNERDTEMLALPTKGRDKKSKQAIETGNSFKDLRQEVKDIQQTQDNFIPFITQVGSQLGFSLPFLAQGGMRLGKGIQSARLQANLQTPIKSAQTTSGLARAGITFGKAIPYIGVAFMLGDFLVNQLPEIISENLYGVGKRLDRRFKRVLENEYTAGVSRQEKTQIAQGYRSVITTSYVAARGATNVANSKVRALNKENLYNKSEEYMI